MTTAAVLPAQDALAKNAPPSNNLLDVEFGDAKFAPLATAEVTMNPARSLVPPIFATYAARILINYDAGISTWWLQIQQSYSLLPDDQRRNKLGRDFGALATSVQRAMDAYLKDQLRQSGTLQDAYTKLARMLVENYGSTKGRRSQQLAILFSLLPGNLQPVAVLKDLTKQRDKEPHNSPGPSASEINILLQDLGALLPSNYRATVDPVDGSYTISPDIALYEVGVDEEFGQTAIATPFGPISSSTLTREVPDYSWMTYALFGISGATGCALTHSIVIPLDVVKTKTQTNPDQYKNILEGAQTIVQNEGIEGLLTGAQATIAGYFWYGLSVYPSYTFFKRWLTQTVLTPEVAAIHINDIALIAGALAAVIASLGLTPLEAARIRVVAEPDRYRPLGLSGTLGVIASENPQVGWKAVYDGLPSLLTRQVIFGSVKFLAFERACEAIYSVWPGLRDATWTALTVSLVAGALSGTVSSIVSQPADSVLTYVAQNGGKNDSSSLGVIDGVKQMIQEEGAGSLFRGLGSRCVWAGSIIAGQFLLYDVFRNYFGVSSQDLSQVFQISMPR